jgi:hypothetical protein
VLIPVDGVDDADAAAEGADAIVEKVDDAG